MNAASSRICVAIVDDDESLCRALVRLFRTAGMEANTYLSAEAFLEDPQRTQYDCIVLDIRLGGMSGIELNRHLAAEASTTPVVFITANADPEVREEALRTPCAGYLRKTDPAEDVLDAIRKACIGVRRVR